MGIRDLQDYIEANCQQACRAVDLIQLGRQKAVGPNYRSAATIDRRGPLRLVVDAESCLHKFYGGYYSDWACGGQWNRMLGFLQNLTQCCRNNNVELIVFFNGATESQKISDWYQLQSERYNNSLGVVRHVYQKGTPPPKAWWIPPAMTATCLRLALKQLGVTVLCSIEDHHHEVISFCRGNDLDGIIAQDSDYLIFGPPHYYSAGRLKLKFSGSLETYEYVVDDIAKMMDLHPNRFCVLAALLGTHLLSEFDLFSFYCHLSNLSTPEQVMQYPRSQLIKMIIDFVRGLPSVDDIDAVAVAIFKHGSGNTEELINRFKQSVQYYVSGTREGFLRSLQANTQPTGTATVSKQPGSYPSNSSNIRQASPGSVNSYNPLHILSHGPGSMQEPTVSNQHCGYSTSLSPGGYGGYNVASAVEPLTQRFSAAVNVSELAAVPGSGSQPERSVTFKELMEQGQAGAKAGSTSSDSLPADRSISAAVAATPTMSAEHVSSQVLNVARERHHKGIMHPWIYQILAQKELKLDVGMEDETNPELPLSADLYRPLRQHVYAILFDLASKIDNWKKLHEDSTNGATTVPHSHKPSVLIKEWSIPRGGGAKLGDRPRCDSIVAEPFEWEVPGVEKLWLGTTLEDKNYRLKSFMSCMRCDSPQNMLLNSAQVPHQYLMFCCVIRYILTCRKWNVFQMFELDALLATAVSPLLQQIDSVQEHALPVVKMRGVHLASLIMKGVEHAIFVNDAVGAPIPWGYSCPWLFFDGKVFHMKLIQAGSNVTLLELCDGSYEQMVYVENMRTAILNGIQGDVFGAGMIPRHLDMDWQHPAAQGFHPSMSVHPAGAPLMQGTGPAGYNGAGDGRIRGGRGAGNVTDARGGRLEVAGVVVGSWGANATLQQQSLSRAGMSRGGPPTFSSRYPPQSGPLLPTPLMSIGPPYRGGMTGRGGSYVPMGEAGRGVGRGAPAEVNYRQNNASRKPATHSHISKNDHHKNGNIGRGRGLTIELNED